MHKFTFIYESSEDEFDSQSVKMEMKGEFDTDDVRQFVKRFLLACGYTQAGIEHILLSKD